MTERKTLLTAIDFWENLVREHHSQGDLYDPCTNGSVTIHPKHDDSGVYYVITPDGIATSSLGTKHLVRSLRGEYELYSTVQIRKAGYMILDEVTTCRELGNVVKSIYASIVDTVCISEDEIISDVTPIYNSKGYLSGFKYNDNRGCEVNLIMKDLLFSYNKQRKEYGKYCLPYIGERSAVVNTKFSLYVYIQQCIEFNNSVALPNVALKTLLSFVPENIKYAWFNLKGNWRIPA